MSYQQYMNMGELTLRAVVTRVVTGPLGLPRQLGCGQWLPPILLHSEICVIT